jgi:hypothetical protein
VVAHRLRRDGDRRRQVVDAQADGVVAEQRSRAGVGEDRDARGVDAYQRVGNSLK